MCNFESAIEPRNQSAIDASPAHECIEHCFHLLQCMSPEVAHNGHGAMSDLSPLCEQERTSADHFEPIGSCPN